MDRDNGEEHWLVSYFKGHIAMRRRAFEDCIGLMSRSISLGCPLLAQCYDCMSASAAILGNKQEAMKYYLLLTTVAPDKARSWNSIGGFYWDTGSLQKAAQSYVKALRCDSKDFATYEELMNLTKQLGNAELSREYETALRQHSEIRQTVLEKTAAWAEALPSDQT